MCVSLILRLGCQAEQKLLSGREEEVWLEWKSRPGLLSLLLRELRDQERQGEQPSVLRDKSTVVITQLCLLVTM